MSIGLFKLISTKKVLKTCNEQNVSNTKNWVIYKPITPLSLSRLKYNEPEPNSKLHVQVRRQLEIKTEGEGSNAEVFQCCEFSQPVEFRRLRNFATCPVCCLTNFLIAFCDFFPNCS